MKWNGRELCAAAVALLLVSYVPLNVYAQSDYIPLDAEQLDRLVAPIALYPDSLVAQVLTASTFPQQIGEAEGWMQQNAGMPPQEIPAAVDPMPWDPSVKALTAFPTVLDNLARNNAWTAQLGNAYFNQPGDVMNAVQAMRVRAQEAGALRAVPHERVFYNNGLIAIEPMDAGLVYVPYYDPWTVYGAPIPAWSGFYWGRPRGVVFAAGLGIGFAAGISLGYYAHYGWGYHHWTPNWRGGVVEYNHTTYISRSTTVIHNYGFGGRNTGAFEHPGRGVPAHFTPAVTSRTAAFHGGAPAAHVAPAPASRSAYGPHGTSPAYSTQQHATSPYAGQRSSTSVHATQQRATTPNYSTQRSANPTYSPHSSTPNYATHHSSTPAYGVQNRGGSSTPAVSHSNSAVSHSAAPAHSAPPQHTQSSGGQQHSSGNKERR